MPSAPVFWPCLRKQNAHHWNLASVKNFPMNQQSEEALTAPECVDFNA